MSEIGDRWPSFDLPTEGGRVHDRLNLTPERLAASIRRPAV